MAMGSYFYIVHLQVMREGQIHRIVESEFKALNIENASIIKESNNLRCLEGDGMLGSPSGYYCTGYAKKTYGLKIQDEEQAEQYIAGYLARAGWTGTVKTARKQVDKERLSAEMEIYTRASLEDEVKKLSDGTHSARTAQIQKEALQKVIDQFNDNPQVNSLVTVRIDNNPID